MDATAAVCEPRRKPFADYESVFPRRAASPDPSIAYEISALVHKLFGRKQRMESWAMGRSIRSRIPERRVC